MRDYITKKGFRYKDTILHSRDELTEAIINELCVLLRTDNDRFVEEKFREYIKDKYETNPDSATKEDLILALNKELEKETWYWTGGYSV